MIYYVQAGKKGFIKIGYAKIDVLKRIGQIQNGCPEKLKLLAVEYGSLKTERRLHEQFKEDKKRGEWFNLSKKLLYYINNIKSIDFKIEKDQRDSVCKEKGIDDLLNEIEKEQIRKAYEINMKNKFQTANYLKIPYRSLRYRLDKYGIK